MARNFIRKDNDNAVVDAALISTPPFCMGVMFKTTVTSNAPSTCMWFGDKDVASRFTRLVVDKNGNIEADSSHTSNFVEAVGNHRDGVWHSLVLAERDAGGQAFLDLYVDGLLKGSINVASPSAVSLFDRVALGRSLGPVPGDSYGGNLAEAFIADVFPTADQVAAWSRGVNVRHVFGTALKGHWPLWGLHSSEIDLSGSANDLTLTATTPSNHAPVTRYTPKWASGLPLLDLPTRRVSIDGVVQVAA